MLCQPLLREDLQLLPQTAEYSCELSLLLADSFDFTPTDKHYISKEIINYNVAYLFFSTDALDLVHDLEHQNYAILSSSHKILSTWAEDR